MSNNYISSILVSMSSDNNATQGVQHDAVGPVLPGDEPGGPRRPTRRGGPDDEGQRTT